MRFLKRWLSTETNLPPESDERLLRILDLAYASLLPPLLLILKLPMILFLLIAVVLIFFRKKATPLTLSSLFMTGLLAIFLSLYGAFGFVGLMHLKLFVELLVYLLVVAVTLQRLTRKVNLYLAISPVLLLGLTLFFFNSIPMLLYTVFEIFFLLWMVVTWQMRSGFAESLRMAGMLFFLSLPLVATLFIFFPRISFGHASYGFRGEGAAYGGHDGTMRLDNGALDVLSGRIVMEVEFKGHIPPEKSLYFRGSVLYIDRIDHWSPLSRQAASKFRPVRVAYPPMFERAENLVIYKISLYPTHKRWLYMLDLPFEAPEGASIGADFEVTLQKPIDRPQIYEASSALDYRYGSNTDENRLRYALTANPALNPMSAREARRIVRAYPDKKERLQAIETFFKKADLTYTLRPDPLDLKHMTDDFLFRRKKGYCVHFAAAFATFCRLAKIPARIVTGYRGSLANSVRNFIAVEERDAHAWVEVFVNRAWRRIETTALAQKVGNDEATAALLRRTPGAAMVKREKSGTRGLSRAELYLLYAKFRIETWILRYSRYRQMQLLERAKSDPMFVAIFLGVFGLLALTAWYIAALLRRLECKTTLRCLMEKLCRHLEKRGCRRAEGETMHRYLQRCTKMLGRAKRLEKIDALYHACEYAAKTPSQRSELLETLKKEVKAFIRG
ncbi:transglutaminaseTgpA domain-containing protein [Hydrogenimonas urashimensis]|uniref:transglutaminase family protein n=1 Tax=Hydrogenimonas urashimensis TaxID=2740515 RepID=UPI0019161E89|nr:DUF3488 and transglutaminase-like domain-containing protein [Hydrogenimonas urashimensis]